ncbi:MAG TPA: lipocalin family protein [Thermomicrobiales bacterium]|nr:lipocalin family protein [Thermomicrobiales bacterium]
MHQACEHRPGWRRCASRSHRRQPLRRHRLVREDGEDLHLKPWDFTASATETWASPRSGATCPASWTMELAGYDLSLDLTPAVSDQELRTMSSTRVIYWEGEVEVRCAFGGEPVIGLGYVELTGCADGCWMGSTREW